MENQNKKEGNLLLQEETVDYENIESLLSHFKDTIKVTDLPIVELKQFKIQ